MKQLPPADFEWIFDAKRAGLVRNERLSVSKRLRPGRR